MCGRGARDWRGGGVKVGRLEKNVSAKSVGWQLEIERPAFCQHQVIFPPNDWLLLPHILLPQPCGVYLLQIIGSPWVIASYVSVQDHDL